MLEAALPALGASGAFSALAIKAPDLLKQIYGDLARPGVAQVGKALETVLGLGNTVLIPLRLLNEAGRKAEERTFEAIAEKLRAVPLDEINAIPPEIGAPLLDHISSSSDPTLRDMYAELLAKSACEGSAQTAHPSFVGMIGSLSPDEAKLIKTLSARHNHPFIRLVLKQKDGVGSRQVEDLVFNNFFQVSHQHNIALYMANLAGLGLIEIRRDAWFSDTSIYDNLFNLRKGKYNMSDEMVIEGESYNYTYDKGIMAVTELGKRFITACVADAPTTS